MTDSILVTFAVVLTIFGIGIVVICFAALRSARFLEQSCASELSQLKSLISNRHLIVSHLSDSIPNKLDGIYSQQSLRERLANAQQALVLVDPTGPGWEELRQFEKQEQSLCALVYELTEALNSAESLDRMPAVTSCLDALKAKSAEIQNKLSTYNSASITFCSFLSSSWVARQRFQCPFSILDFEPVGSSMLDENSNSGNVTVS